MSAITSIDQFKLEIRCCIELAIPRRKFDYTHHVFIGDVDDYGCDLYHYAFSVIPAFKFNSPGKITKVRLNYERYRACAEILSIFNFDNGDVVFIVNRDDYPSDKNSEEDCIKKANSRLGEEMYSASDNNCQSYVNWIFSNDNTSKQIKSSPSKRFAADAVDGLCSTGLLHPLMHLASGVIHNSDTSKDTIVTMIPKKKTPSEDLVEKEKNLIAQKSEKENKKIQPQEKKKLKKNKSKEVKKENHGEKSMNAVSSLEKTKNKKIKGDTGIANPHTNKKKTNAKIEIKQPQSFKDTIKSAEMTGRTGSLESQKLETESKKFKTKISKEEIQSHVDREKLKTQPEKQREKSEPVTSQKLNQEIKYAQSQNMKENIERLKSQKKRIEETPKNDDNRGNTYSHILKKEDKISCTESWQQNMKSKQSDQLINELERLKKEEIISKVQKITNEKEVHLHKAEKPIEQAAILKLKNESEQCQPLRLKVELERLEKEKINTIEQEIKNKTEMHPHKAEIYHLPTVEEKLMRPEKDAEFFSEKRLKENESRKSVKSEKNPPNSSSNSSDGINSQCLQMLGSLASGFDKRHLVDIPKALNPFSVDKSSTSLKAFYESYAKDHLATQAAKKVQDEGIKQVSQSLSTAAVCFSAVVEIGSLTRKFQNIKNNEHMTDDQKARCAGKEVWTSLSGVAGSALGQLFIPIPGVGSMIGGAIGNVVGGIVGGGLYS
ncbi:titin homolog [Crassostrea angulata]|uniref:titin homolog n=1 Tax=Magallana angulata TaxID=2784310 RepID=UPI0022B15C44|nr:titin homolog [Crassostrea angulata]